METLRNAERKKTEAYRTQIETGKDDREREKESRKR